MGIYTVTVTGLGVEMGGLSIDYAETYRDMGARGLTDRAERELAMSYADTMAVQVRRDGQLPASIVVRNCLGGIVRSEHIDRES